MHLIILPSFNSICALTLLYTHTITSGMLNTVSREVRAIPLKDVGCNKVLSPFPPSLSYSLIHTNHAPYAYHQFIIIQPSPPPTLLYQSISLPLPSSFNLLFIVPSLPRLITRYTLSSSSPTPTKPHTPPSKVLSTLPSLRLHQLPTVPRYPGYRLVRLPKPTTYHSPHSPLYLPFLYRSDDPSPKMPLRDFPNPVAHFNEFVLFTTLSPKQVESHSRAAFQHPHSGLACTLYSCKLYVPPPWTRIS